jgi:hypothetical protein
MNIFVRPNGSAQCLYSEDICLASLGALDIKRASHVEPDPANPGKWLADLSPVGGPMLGPFNSRSDALAAEAKWLDIKMAEGHVSNRDAAGTPEKEDRALCGPFDHL